MIKLYNLVDLYILVKINSYCNLREQVEINENLHVKRFQKGKKKTSKQNTKKKQLTNQVGTY